MKLVILTLALGLLLPGALTKGPDAPGQPTGSHGLRNRQFGMFLRPRDASNREGEPIVLYPYQTWKCMAWRFDSEADGTRLVNYFTGKSFAVAGGAGSAAVVQQGVSAGGQAVRFTALPGGVFWKIEASGGVLTARDMDHAGDVRVVIEPWTGAPAQQWQLVDLPGHFTG